MGLARRGFQPWPWLYSCVTLGQLFGILQPQFPHSRHGVRHREPALGLTVSETKQALFLRTDMLTMVGDTANEQGHLR